MASYQVSAVTETTGLAGQSRNNYTNRFKIDFMAEWDQHIHTKTKVAELIAKKKGKMGGFESLGSVITGLPQSAGLFQFEGATLPDPRAGSYINPKLHARDVYTRLRWTGNVERAARGGDKYAWRAPRKQDIKGADEQMRINLARCLYLGPAQPIGLASAAADTSLTMYSRNSRRSNLDDLWKFGAHYLRVGQSISLVDASGGAVVLFGNAPAHSAELIVNAISSAAAPVITLSADIEDTLTPDVIGDESLVIPYQSRRTTGVAQTDITTLAGMNGLMQMVTNGDIYTYLYDLERAANPTLNGLRDRDSGGVPRAFNEDLVTIAVDRVADEGRGDEPGVLLMDRSVRREYVKESKGDRRFKEVQTEKGFGKLVFHAGDALLPVETDRDCPPGIIFVLEPNGFGYLEQSAMDTLPERFVANQDASEIIVHKSGNVFTEAPFNNGTIEDLIFDVSAVTV